jgi:5'-nucleotidase
MNQPDSLPLILLTNDDGIDSPGLWAAAQAVLPLGEPVIVAPRRQYSGAGRSLPAESDGVIEPYLNPSGESGVRAYAVGGSPAQAVLLAVLEILPRPPALVISGINFGENVGSGVTISGTVGAALEAAAQGLPALAVSLETDPAFHQQHSPAVDFAAAQYFTQRFARLALEAGLPPGVDVLKVDIPAGTTSATPCLATRLSRQVYWQALRPQRADPALPAAIPYAFCYQPARDTPDTDAYAVHARRVVSVTPLTLDLTAPVGLDDIQRYLAK